MLYGQDVHLFMLYGWDVHLFIDVPAFILQPNVVLVIPHIIQAEAGELVMNVAGSVLIFSLASFKRSLTCSLSVGYRYMYSLGYSTRLHCSLLGHLSLSLKHTTLHHPYSPNELKFHSQALPIKALGKLSGTVTSCWSQDMEMTV